MILLHQNETSPFCDKVRRVLHYKRRAYETNEVPPHEALFQVGSLSPTGNVPVIEHQGNTVADSTDIARYLDQAFPDPPIYPATERDRALCHFLEDWADESLYFFEVWLRYAIEDNANEWSRRTSRSEPPLLRRATERALPTLMRNMLRAQGLGRKEPEVVLREFEVHVEQLNVWLVGDWLVGDHLTVADIAVFAQLACALDAGEGAAILAARPRLLAWMERVNASTAT